MIKNKRKLNFYYFGEIGNYDEYNPAFVCSKEHAAEILFLIAEKEPFSISKHDIVKYLNIKEVVVEEIINSLKFIDAIDIKADTYRIKFPVFLEKDVIETEKYINDIGQVVGSRIIELKDILHKKVLELNCSNYHSFERILYHIVCDKIFDGTAFDFFTERNTFCASKIQPGNRDYIIVAYEDSSLVEKHSNKLLCSSNNYRSGGYTFNSFGDSDGLRKDMYRFFRLVQSSVSHASLFDKVNVVYNSILDNSNREVAFECGELISNILNKSVKYNELTEKKKGISKFLEELEYITINSLDDTISVLVPVFYSCEIKTIITDMSEIILRNIFPVVKEIFDSFETNASNLTSVRHRVDIKETANELWHQIFGAANEYLVKEGFVELPVNIDGQGRYLRSITIP